MSIYSQKLIGGFARVGLAVISNAIGNIFSGTGDLSAFKHIILLYASVESECSYGVHMAFQSAIGMLFLARGTQSLGQSDLAIACLFISSFPLFPSKCTDLRNHVQAFRHLWSLATEDKMLVTTDVETNNLIRVPIQIQTKHGTFQKITPCLLSHSAIERVSILGGRFWSFDIPKEVKTVSVQRDTPQEDCHPRFYLASRSRNPKNPLHDIVPLLKYVDKESFLAGILERTSGDCILKDSFEILNVYLWLHNSVEEYLAGHADAQLVKWILCLFEFCKEQNTVLDNGVIDVYQDKMNSAVSKSNLSKWMAEAIQRGGLELGHERKRIASYLSFVQFPKWPQIQRFQREIEKLQYSKPMVVILLKMEFPQTPISTISLILDGLQ